MNRTALLTSTGNPEVDALLRQLIAAYEAAFPGRVRGCYLLGSHADGTALPVSDVERHRTFVLEQLRGDDPGGRLFAAERLQWVVYPDPEVRAALADACADPDERVLSAALRALALAAADNGEVRG